jgi:hypothetical protein
MFDDPTVMMVLACVFGFLFMAAGITLLLAELRLFSMKEAGPLRRHRPLVKQGQNLDSPDF